jgi:toxin-antitoxin system PIN domain toxin
LTLPDVNVLVEAFRPGLQRHQLARQWLMEVVNGQAAFGISPQVLASVVRICTNRSIFPQPSTLEETLDFADKLMTRPQCSLIHPGPAHWGIFTKLCRQSNAKGNLVQDAWLAALAIEHECEWVTLDRDFVRFPGLRWRQLA